MQLSPLFQPVGFHELPDWASGRHLSAFEAFRRSAVHVLNKPYRTGSLGVRFESFQAAYVDSRETSLSTDDQARRFFERHFVPARLSAEASAKGFVTGFYEPVVRVSSVRTERFAVPLLSRPDDLIDIDDRNRPAGLDPYLAFGLQTDIGLVEYYDRAAIEMGALEGRGLEMAWLESAVDAFFIHVQGAARLEMEDGSIKRITYAAKSGQRFTAIGRLLADMGEITLDKVTMQSIRAWLAAHSARRDEILRKNRSYIFFRVVDAGDPSLGPVAAAKVQLTPGSSVAVDRLLHTFGTPFYISAPTLRAFGTDGFHRLMIAQDTGSAILGSARGDLFTGSGDEAGDVAGVIRNEADFYALLPRPLLEGDAP